MVCVEHTLVCRGLFRGSIALDAESPFSAPAVMMAAVMGSSAMCLTLLLVLHAPLQGQPPARRDTTINIYHYALDLEVPESPAVVALDLMPSRTLAATAPKPVGL